MRVVYELECTKENKELRLMLAHDKHTLRGQHFEEQNYEMFCDSAYFDMWCVRNINDKRFESPTSFHFDTEEEAQAFKKLIEVAK